MWTNLPSSERYKLRLRGEPVADLDYSAMFAMLAYRRAGLALPKGDPYDIPMLSSREAAKRGLLALLSRSGPMQRLGAELRALLPEGWTAQRLQEVISREHRGIAHLFGTDVGLELMAAESRIIVAMLLKLAALDVASLQMFDGCMTREGDVELVAQVMREASLEVAGEVLPVRQKCIWRPPLR